MLHRAAFLYMEEGLVASTELVLLQGAFNTLTRLFGRVGLKKIVRKTVSIICPQSQQQLWVQCPDCGSDLAMG